jgi:hypothetical protein
MFMTRRAYANLVLVAAIALCLLVLLDNRVFGGAVASFLGEKVFSSVVQFALITLLGGVVTLFVGLLKDDEEARAKQRERERQILADLDKAYRSTQPIRRVLRSRSQKTSDGLEIPIEFFEKNLDELNHVQLSLEQLRNLGLTEVDALHGDRASNVRRAIRYSARYLHDVFQDFEQSRVDRTPPNYVITARCTNLCDFVGPVEVPVDIANEFDVMTDDKKTLNDRWQAFNKINSKRKSDPNGRRYKPIAEECFALVQAELSAEGAISQVGFRAAIRRRFRFGPPIRTEGWATQASDSANLEAGATEVPLPAIHSPTQ